MSCENAIINVASSSGKIYLGVFDTLNVRSQQFDISEWISRFGAGQLFVLVLRPGETVPYAAQNVNVENGIATWTFNEADTELTGFGSCALAYLVGEEYKARTIPFKTYVAPTLGDSTVDPPDPLIGWFERVLEAAAEAQQSATDAAAAQTAAETAKGKAETAQRNAAGSADYAANRAQYAEELASDAESAADDAEAYAIGERSGEPVEPGDIAYHNNAKYYAEIPVTTTRIAAGAVTLDKLAQETLDEIQRLAYVSAEDLSAAIAPLYENGSTYSAGDYVTYELQLYRALQDIEDDEWTPSHWQMVTVRDAINDALPAVPAQNDTYVLTATRTAVGVTQAWTAAYDGAVETV